MPPRNKKLTPALPPRLLTRATNKNAHPGAPDLKKAKRSKEEMAKARADAQAAKAAKAAKSKAAVHKVAALEDEMRDKDDETDRHANNPPPKFTGPPFTAAVAPPPEKADNSDDNMSGKGHSAARTSLMSA